MGSFPFGDSPNFPSGPVVGGRDLKRGAAHRAAMPAPEPLLVHEDPEGALLVLPSPIGYTLAIRGASRGAPFEVKLTKEDLKGWVQEVLDAVDSSRRVADVRGPSDGKHRVSALIAPGDEGEDLMVMIVREGVKGDEAEMELVHFSNRDHLGQWAEDVLVLP